MSALSELQVELIRGNIRHGGIETVDLEDDLLDHICCAIEDEMRQNTPFEKALTKVKEAICPNGFKEIQQEATYLLTLKFNKMKKTMNVLGTIGASLLMLGSVLKILHMIGAGASVVLGAGILALFYLPFMLTMALKQTDNWMSKLKHFAAYAAGTAVVLGILFKIQHWPGARVMLLGGLMSFVFVYLPLHLKFTARDAILKIQPVTSAVLLFAACSLLFAYGYSNQSYSHKYNLAMSTTANRLAETANERIEANNIKAAINSNTATEKVHTAATDVTDYVEELKAYLLSQYFPKGNFTSTELPPFFAMEDRGEQTDAVLLNRVGNLHLTNGAMLQEKLEDFNNALTMHGIDDGIDLSDQLSHHQVNQSWLEYQFSHKPVFAVFVTLSQIQLEVANMEADALQLFMARK